MPTKRQHIAWAEQNTAEYRAALDRWQVTHNPVYLTDAIRAAYGAQLNRLDAGQGDLAREALSLQAYLRDVLVESLRR